MNEKTARVGNLFVNERGFVYADGSKICRLVDGQLEFLHKGAGDSRKRGEVVRVAAEDLVRLVAASRRD